MLSKQHKITLFDSVVPPSAIWKLTHNYLGFWCMTLSNGKYNFERMKRNIEALVHAIAMLWYILRFYLIFHVPFHVYTDILSILIIVCI